jgi:hypothetical protein
MRAFAFNYDQTPMIQPKFSRYGAEAPAASWPAEAQGAPAVLMVRPARFGFNPQTAQSNRFQREVQESSASSARALAEFSALHGALKAAGVRTCVVEDTAQPAKPDAVFPNNWVSFHGDGTIVLYPMHAANRRAERRADILAMVEAELTFNRRRLLDFSAEETRGRYLEGTGSLVLDHINHVAYACRSARTDESLVHEWARAMEYQAEVFDASDPDGQALYHTNVMLAIGSRCAVICSEAVAPKDRQRVLERLKATGRELIEVSMAAMYAFACNVLELRVQAQAGPAQSVLVMSSKARAAFDAKQWAQLDASVDRIVDVAIPTIETQGGGGMRCMLAEVPESRA